MNSITLAFILAFAKTLLKCKIVDLELLRSEFLKIRRDIKHYSPMEVGDAAVLKFLEIPKDQDPGKDPMC